MALDEAVTKYKEITNKDANCTMHCMCSCDKCVQESGHIVEWLEELKAYRIISTIDECITAVDKQKAKKIVRVKLRQSEWGSEYRCPVCESDLIKTVFFDEDGTEPDEKISWCSGCGQKLDWSDGNE